MTDHDNRGIRSPMVCCRCGRQGSRGFTISSGTGDGRDTYCCSNRVACDRRERRGWGDAMTVAILPAVLTVLAAALIKAVRR